MKKLLSLLLCLAVLLSVFTINFNVASAEEAAGLYTDVSDDYWAYTTIEKCNTLKIFGGYPDGSFKPDNNISRAEAVKAVSVVYGKNTKVTPEGKLFGIDKNEWYAPFVYVCQNILPTYWKQEQSPDFEKNITREDAIYLTTAALGYKKDFENANTNVLNKFTDSADISTEMQKPVAFALENGMIKGNPDGSLKPQSPITRAEFTSLICSASGLTKNDELNWSMENVTETNGIRRKDGMFHITSKDYFKTEFIADTEGYYNVEMGYAHDDYECYYRFDITYADGTTGGFMQGLLHGKNKIEMKVYLKKGVNKINIRHHSADGTFIYYIKNNGLANSLNYEISPKNENYFMDSPKELKTVIRNWRSPLVKITSETEKEIDFESENKAVAVNVPDDIPDEFYSSAIFVTLKNSDVEALGEGTHTLYYHLENGEVLEQELNIAPITPNTDLKIINFSVDKANSTLIMLPNGKNLLVDSATKAMAQDRVIPYLQENGIKLDYYLLTHFHSDHNGLKSQILKDNEISSPDTKTAENLCLNGTKEERYKYLKDFGYLDSKMLCCYDEIDKIWDLGGVKIEVTNSRYDENGNKLQVYNYPYFENNEHNYENSTSVSFMLTYNGFGYYHSADNYGYNQDRYMAEMIKSGRGDELRAHWFYGNHHFINSINTEFINTLNPVAVYIPNVQIERRGAYWYHYKENVENYYFSHKRLADTFVSINTDNARICVNSADDWYYETFR